MTSQVRKETSPTGVLGDLGFTPDHELVYTTLLNHGWEGLTETATRTGLEQPHFQNCIDALATRGVVTIEDDHLTVADPMAAVGALIEQREDELMQAYRRVSSLRSHLPSLVMSRASTAPTKPRREIERLDGLSEVRSRIAELSFFARDSVMAIHPGGPQSKASIEASRPLDRRATRRGMRVQVIHEQSVLTDDVNRSYLQELTSQGVQVRLNSSVPKRLIILDEEVALVPIDPRDSRAGALLVRQPSLIAGLVELFQRTWEASQELEEPGCEDEDATPLDDRDRRLLMLLSSGSTDESIARELAISVRHLRRQISRIMAALGAQSRFEAGVEASKRGWI